MVEKEVFVFPTSFAQQRLWFLDQLEPGGTAYNMPAAVCLHGPLNAPALERSLNEIVRRHEALRTTFSVMEGQPVQVIAPKLTLALPLIDLRGLLEPEREAEVSRLSAQEAQRPFKLAQGPLVRVTLLRLGDQEHVLLVTMHHIVSDGWSMGVLFQELSVLYEAFSQGKPSPLPELPIQYADFAVWQRKWLQGEVLEKQLAYWKRQLAGAPPVLELPTDRPRPAVQTYRGARQSLVLSQKLSEGLKELSREEGVTLFMTLLAAFKTLLYRYSGQEDVVVGSPIAARNRAEIEGLIGFFISTLVLRTDLSGNPTFRALLGRVREGCLGAYAHQDLPFEKLVEELQPERDLSHTPLFQVFFNMIYLGDDRGMKLVGLKVEPLGSYEPASKFDLTMYVGDQGGTLWFSLVYNVDLFEPATIARMLSHYQTLLKGIVANPDHSISSLPLLTEEERSQLSSRTNLIRATNPFVEFRKEEIEQSIPSRFERQVERYPDHVAVRTKEHRWSYRELNRMANQAAHTLLRACGGGEERVGLLFEHGAPMIAAILGVLKAGKTYVPLDPEYPAERLAYVLQDSHANVLLTSSKGVAFATTLTNGRLRLFDVDETQDAESAKNLNLAISPDAVAYILYTSGSTGQPKGVVQNHRNVLHHIRCYTNSLHIASADKLTLFSSYGFDAAVMDTFGALLNGATLYPLDMREKEPAALRRRIVEEAVNIYHSTPTVYRYLCDGLSSRADLSAIRLVVLGGEEIQKADVEMFKKYFSKDCILVNGLGPTESTLALQCFIDHESKLPGKIVPVGYPVQDTEVLLLNEAGMDAEVYGEIGVRSEHVALGYWRRPELTRAAFFPDSQGGSRRLYRTGDMGRLLPDGSIVFLGRRDSQVKIRGFRIELGEIETALGQHPAVREAVVLAREDTPNDKRLVAYVVPSQSPAPAAGELHGFVKEKLPQYMVPSAFVFLDALPLTPNGKIDRRALPAPDRARPELKEAVVLPRTPVEKVIAAIWVEVLKLEQVGIHDNFFELGGHSLLAIRVISRVRTTFQIVLPLRILFEKPTIEELAVVITERQAEGAGQDDLAHLLAEMDALSDAGAERLLAEKNR